MSVLSSSSDCSHSVDRSALGGSLVRLALADHGVDGLVLDDDPTSTAVRRAYRRRRVGESVWAAWSGLAVCFGIGSCAVPRRLVSQAVGAGRRDASRSFAGGGDALDRARYGGHGRRAAGGAASGRAVSVARAGHFAAQYSRSAHSARRCPALRGAARARYGQGDSRAPMRASLAGNAVKCALDTLLILGLGWASKAPRSRRSAKHHRAVAARVADAPRAARLVLRRGAMRDVWAQGVPMACSS